MLEFCVMLRDTLLSLRFDLKNMSYVRRLMDV